RLASRARLCRRASHVLSDRGTFESDREEGAMRRIRIVALLVAPLLMASTVASGSNYARGSLDRYFRIDFKVVPGPGGQVVEGYVYNLAGMPAERMLLEIDQLDASGAVVGNTSTRVLG